MPGPIYFGDPEPSFSDRKSATVGLCASLGLGPVDLACTVGCGVDEAEELLDPLSDAELPDAQLAALSGVWSVCYGPCLKALWDLVGETMACAPEDGEAVLAVDVDAWVADCVDMRADQVGKDGEEPLLSVETALSCGVSSALSALMLIWPMDVVGTRSQRAPGLSMLELACQSLAGGPRPLADVVPRWLYLRAALEDRAEAVAVAAEALRLMEVPVPEGGVVPAFSGLSEYEAFLDAVDNAQMELDSWVRAEAPIRVQTGSDGTSDMAVPVAPTSDDAAALALAAPVTMAEALELLWLEYPLACKMASVQAATRPGLGAAFSIPREGDEEDELVRRASDAFASLMAAACAEMPDAEEAEDRN